MGAIQTRVKKERLKLEPVIVGVAAETIHRSLEFDTWMSLTLHV